MRLKKWGSLLTALAMIGSMATYVPATVSADTPAATPVPDTVYSGELDYVTNAAYEFNVTQETLVISPVDATKAYEVPASILEEVSMEFLADKDSAGVAAYDTPGEVAAVVETITFKGDVTINGEDVTDAPSTVGKITGLTATTVNVDCRAEIKYNSITSDPAATEEKTVALADAKSISDGATASNIVHEYQANTTYHNHMCVNCLEVNNTTAHKFGKNDEGVTIDKIAHTHTCECGKVDTDYLVKNEDGSYMTVAQCEAIINDGEASQAEIDAATANKASIEKYQAIHGFVEASDHFCDDCGAYDVVTHQGANLKIEVTADKHTVVCKKNKDTDCGYAEAAQAHTFAPYYNASGAAKIDLNGYYIASGEHYCTVCGYVPGRTQSSTQGNPNANEAYSGTHSYNYKFAMVKNSTTGDYEKKIVSATTAAEKVVCLCGAVKPGHGNEATTEADKHKFVGAEGIHLCICGATDEVHNYKYNYNGQGVYTVNGQSGFVMTADNAGAVCECGDKSPSNHPDAKCAFEQKSIDTTNANIKNNIYVDTVNHKHYCTCGKLIVDVNSKEVHDYTNKIENKMHVCACGATTEKNHNYTATDSGSDMVSYYAVVKHDGEKKLAKFVGKSSVKTEMADATSDDATYGSDWYIVVGGKKVAEVDSVTDTRPADYTMADGTTKLYFNATNAVICQCGKVDPAHVHEFDIANMAVDGVHYCECGAASEEHTYGTDNRCKICNKYVEHQCEPTSLNNCACKTCGVDVHDLIVYNTTSHKCVRCNAVVPAHNYVIDETKHTHTCSICAYVYNDANTDGEPNPHRYGETGEAQCVCTLCGFENHDVRNTDNLATTDVKEKHYCAVCSKDLSDVHNYGNTDRCACGLLKTGHVHAFSKQAINSGNDIDGVAYLSGDELCKCEKKLEHEFDALDTATAGNHMCVHTVAVTAADPSVTTTSISKCAKVVAHDYSVEGSTKPADFCNDCGAVNPTVLTKVLNDYNDTKLNNLKNDYTAAYVVRMTKAVEALRKYSIKAVANPSDFVTDTNAISKILTVNTDEEKTAFYAALDEFNAAVAAKDANQISGKAVIKPFDTDSTGRYSAYDNTYITVTDSTGSYPALAGQVNDEVTIQVKVAKGYKFDGWYSAAKAVATTDPTPEKIGDSAKLTVKLGSGTKNYYAKIVENTKVNIGFKGAGINYYSTKLDNNPIATVNNESISVPVGDEVFMWFTETTDSNDVTTKFQGFDCNGYSYDYNTYFNKSTKKEASAADYDGTTVVKAFKIEVSEKAEYTLTTYKNDNNNNVDFYVVYRNSGKDIGYGTAVSGNSAAFQPDDPSMEGYNFLGWYFEDDANEEIVKTKKLTRSGILVPKFDPISGLKFTIGAGGRFAKSADAAINAGEGFDYGTSVYLTADLQNAAGKYFSGWYINNVRVSKRITETFKITSNMTVVPMYDGTEELVPESTYVLTGSRTKVDNYQRLVLSAKWAMAEEAVEIVDTGYVFSLYGMEDLSVDKVDGSVIKKKSTGLDNKIGSYDFTMNLKTSPNATVTAKFYVTYVNENGENVTVYSDMIKSTALN